MDTHERSMHFIAEILKVLRSTHQHEQVLHLIVDRLVRIYRARTCAVVLIDVKTEYLSIENSIGLSGTFCKAFRRRLAVGAIGELLWTGKPLLIQRCEEQQQLAAEVQLEYSCACCIAVQIASDHRTLGYLYIDSEEEGTFSSEDVQVIQVFADMAAVAIHKSHLHDENTCLDKIDHETGLFKYESFLEAVRCGLERAEQFDEHFAVLILDVDNFKALVQTYGYETSKQFLGELGFVVKEQLRNIDAGGRYGFDEIIVLLANSGLEQAVASARRLSLVIEEHPFTDYRLDSTVSIGVAAYPENGTLIEDLLLAAKNALFEAQRAGRNNVFHFVAAWHERNAVLVRTT